MAFAEHQFRRGRVLEDGATEGDHRDSGAKQWAALGRRDLAKKVEDETPEFPYELRYLWKFFCEHSLGLQVSGMAPPVITWESLQAWSMFMGVALEPWEALTMVRLGHLRASIEGEKQKTNGDQHQDRSG